MKKELEHCYKTVADQKKEIVGYQQTIKKISEREIEASGENMKEAKVVVEEIDEDELRMLEEQLKAEEEAEKVEKVPVKEAEPETAAPIVAEKEVSIKSIDLP